MYSHFPAANLIPQLDSASHSFIEYSKHGVQVSKVSSRIVWCVKNKLFKWLSRTSGYRKPGKASQGDTGNPDCKTGSQNQQEGMFSRASFVFAALPNSEKHPRLIESHANLNFPYLLFLTGVERTELCLLCVTTYNNISIKSKPSARPRDIKMLLLMGIIRYVEVIDNLFIKTSQKEADLSPDAWTH